jgi:hypothetical protein
MLLSQDGGVGIEAVNFHDGDVTRDGLSWTDSWASFFCNEAPS